MSLKNAITIMAIFSNDTTSLQYTETSLEHRVWPTSRQCIILWRGKAHNKRYRGYRRINCFFDLCRFDPVQDAVIDAMHALSLNLICTELEDRLLADLGANSTLHPQERLLLNGGLLDCNDLARALLKVDWTTEMKNGRLLQVCPSQPHGKHKLGYCKSEEFPRFAEVAPLVLHSIVPKKAYDCFHLLHQIHKLIFSTRLCIQGWWVVS